MNTEGIKAGMEENFYHAQTWAISLSPNTTSKQ